MREAFEMARGRLVLCLILVGAFLILGGNPTIAAGSDEPLNGKLGFGVFLQPGADVNGDGLEKTNRLWFALQRGTSSSRKFTVSSTSSVSQRVQASTIAGSRENGGELTQAPDRDDPMAEWFSFEPSEFVLKPGQSVEVVLTVAAPDDATDGVIENFIKFQAEGVAKPDLQYKIPTAIAYVQRSMVTIGNADAMAVDFDIIDVEGFKGDEGPSLRIYFDNTGGVPVSLAGSTQLSSLDFDGVRSEQYSFLSNIILPGGSGYADVLMTDPVAAGRWRVFVSAYQGSTEKTATFERDLTFDGPPRGAQRPFSLDIQKILFLLIALGLLIAGIRVMRSGQWPDGGKSSDTQPEPSGSQGGGTASIDEAQLARDLMDRLTVMKGVIASRTAPIRKRLKELAVEENVAPNVDSVSPEKLEIDSGAKSHADQPPAPVVPDQPDGAGGSGSSSTPEKAGPTRASNDLSKEKSSYKASANALRELKKLLDEGIISQDEFERKRREILKRF